MEAILVTVSVLSTLLVVGIVLSVVIVFNKLKDKVDVRVFENIHNENKKEVDLIYNEISSLKVFLQNSMYLPFASLILAAFPRFSGCTNS